MMIKNVLKVSAMLCSCSGWPLVVPDQEAIDQSASHCGQLQQETQRQPNLLLKLHVQQPIAQHRQLQPLKALQIGHCAASEAHRSCCDANRDRLERMFQKSMSK